MIEIMMIMIIETTNDDNIQRVLDVTEVTILLN